MRWQAAAALAAAAFAMGDAAAAAIADLYRSFGHAC